MEDTGWIKLHRKIRNSNMYKTLKASQRDVMIQCLLLANHKKNQWIWEGKSFKCNPGQFITSLKSLKKLCAVDVTERKIRTALNNLAKWEFLTIKTTKTGSLITICNWTVYQGYDEKNDIENSKDLSKTEHNHDKDLTTNKKDKNIKNYKKNYKSIYYENRKKRRNSIQEIEPIRSY